MSAPQDHEAIGAQLGAYFDGELGADDERAVLEHLADCARCQDALDDLMGLHVALGRSTSAIASAPTASVDSVGPAPHNPVVPLAPRRARRGWAIAGLALAAAAAAVVVVRTPWRKHRSEPELALGDTRPVEVRFSAPAFEAYRPYRVERGGPEVSPVPLSTLAALERRGDRSGLAAALAWSGDQVRAGAVLDSMSPTPTALADRAAIALLRGHAEDALEDADRALIADEHIAAARWNRSLALRDLHLPLAAAAELDRLAALREPGWSDEAVTRAAALRGDLTSHLQAVRDAARRRKAAIAGGPPMTAADVAIAPTVARLYFHDALRLAGSVAELDRLAPLAAGLDAQSRGGEAARELSRVRGLDLKRRARFADRYRAVAARTASPEAIDGLLVELAAGGVELDDIRLGVILWSGRLHDLVDDVATIVRDSGNPMVQLLAVQEHVASGRESTADRELIDRVCDNPAWALRCGTIDRLQAAALADLGRTTEAERLAWRAVERLTRDGTGVEDEPALIYLAEVLRGRGRLALSAAVFAEVRARSSQTECKEQFRIRGGEAEVARRRGDYVHARDLLAVPGACPGGDFPTAVGAAVDLARDSGASADRDLADRWIAAGRTAGVSPRLSDVAEARLHIVDQPERSRSTLAHALAAPDADQNSQAVADWAWRTLITDDGQRGDWKAAFDHGLAAVGQTGPTTCAIALTADDAIVTAAWRDAQGDAGGVQWRQPAVWPPLPVDAVRGCTTTAIVALSPLHGRPPPWSLGAWAWSTGRPSLPTSAVARNALVVAATNPPREGLDLPALAPVAIAAGAHGLTGTDATPARVATAMATATYVEIHAHGLVDLAIDDGGFIALSPDPDGRWRLTASDVRKLKLTGAPVVVLAACRAAEGTYDVVRRWSLPDAFLAAGARAVIAADVAVPDDLIRAFVDDVRGRLEHGEEPAVAAAAARAALVARDPTSASWVERLMVFE